MTLYNKLRLNYEIDPGIMLGGEVPRIDFNAGPAIYNGILLGPSDADWASKPSMPVLQYAIAARIQRDPTEVAVGVQGLDGSGLRVVQYNPAQIRSALSTVRRVAVTARDLLESS